MELNAHAHTCNANGYNTNQESITLHAVGMQIYEYGSTADENDESK